MSSLDNFFSNATTSGDVVLCQFGGALRGPLGWFMIAFGVLIAVWEFFVQKQGHLLVVTVIGVVCIILLGRLLPQNCNGNGGIVHTLLKLF